ncbi:MAG TPA: bifunctional diguanylate cyclase/phosphodiesterase [Xanthobacteraceae bacterium]|jgi:diguanylate cyclase (GGDEF)-like protein|nr:bifunctional diguanylate cyclase/phosphodiesterase [Xanthobacteraceae bacterium]
MPVGVIVVISIICIAVAILISAKRANEAAIDSEQQLIRNAIVDRGQRAMRVVENVAAAPHAVDRLRTFDTDFIERRIGHELGESFHFDIAAIIGTDDKIKYIHTAAQADGLPEDDVRTDFSAALDVLRGRLATLPDDVLALPLDEIIGRLDASAGLIENSRRGPAYVIAAAVVADGQRVDGAPIIIGLKYINDRLLSNVGRRLQLDGLHVLAAEAPAADERIFDLKDARNENITRLAFKPKLPGGGILIGAVPFIALALLGICLLIGVAIRTMRKTGAAVAASEQQLRHLAMHDPVSGLPNRIYFAERLEKAINEVRGGGLSAAVFYIDLDHFKDVNDTLGHHIGDALILAVTQRLARVMRAEDLVARLGGDEFAIITNCESDSYSLQAIAGRIISAVCAPYLISGHNIIIGASIGIAVIDRRNEAADILRYADMALYRAKNEGRNRACIYDAAMDADLSNRKLLEGDLLQAIKNDVLRAAYQPIVNASGEVVVGVEALARWTHPTHGEIPPSRFIPIAEHSGLIIELGEWMLRRACLDGRDWPGLTVAVNVSPLQFRRSDFVEVVERILTETDFDANRLELELTESTLLGNLDTAELSMLRLKAIGVRFALDDFGTGYSSLLYLRRFPFDKLKIDSSFVRSIEKAPDAAAIVHAVVSLGRGLGMKVTAEGVETPEQHLFLRAAGVHSMQGYRFGKPGPASELTERLATPDKYRVGSPDQEVALAS